MSRLQLAIVIYICVIIVDFLAVLYSGDLDFDCTPKQMYESTNLNMFGCCVLWLIFFILNPILFICKFIGWIFTVGRKDEDE